MNAERQMDWIDEVRRGEEGKRSGMERGTTNAREEWKREARAAAIRVAYRGLPFTTDDIYEEMLRSGVDVETHDLRAMGGVLSGLRCVRRIPGSFEPSRLAVCHRRPKQRWILREAGERR